jgi:hypothetical protein
MTKKLLKKVQYFLHLRFRVFEITFTKSESQSAFKQYQEPDQISLQIFYFDFNEFLQFQYSITSTL